MIITDPFHNRTFFFKAFFLPGTFTFFFCFPPVCLCSRKCVGWGASFARLPLSHANPAGLSMPERIDPTDGKAYPLESFLEVYGEEDGRRRWAIAEMWTWKLQHGGLKVTISLAGGGTVSDDDMVRRAAHLGDVMHYVMLDWDGNSPLNMTLDCANRGFGDKGMLALCYALVKIRQPRLCSCLKLYSLRITDASMPHIANVLKVYEGGVSELHLSHNVGITNQGVKTLCNKDILQYYPLRNARSGLLKPLLRPQVRPYLLLG